jgi:uncharacterized protein
MLARGNALTFAAVATFAVLGCTTEAPPAAPASPPAAASTPAPSTGYDAALAQRLGADEHGMHKYVLALLKKGPNRAQPPDEAKRLMQAHLANIARLADEGSLVVAGPFLDDGPLSGIYIFKVDTVEAARALTETDPAIKAGRLEMELHPWYGTAALQETYGLHKRLEKKSVAE